MAVSILQRPQGYHVNDVTGVFQCSIEESAGVPGAVAVFYSGHQLASDVDIVYMKTSVEDYNGFVIVDVADANQFRIKDLEGNYISFIKDVDVAYFYKTESQSLAPNSPSSVIKWSCVHLPIVYKLSNTLWPSNSADTIRDITGVTDSTGYCNITASGDIKATGSAQVLDFVKITGATNEDYNGVWQIVSYSSDTSFTIDLPYSSGADTDLTNNASIQFYYNNYVVKVQIWGGLNNGHEWYAQKPYELLATLNLIPDEDNQVVFSISEILRKHIEMENNLLLGTLPNNLDAFTMFFIKYGEEYDDSTQIYVGRTAVSYTSDLSSFEGRAMNAILPFKNVHSGIMSEYLLNSEVPGKFLTNFDEPTLFTGKYFDLGFLWDGVNDIFFGLKKYLNSVLSSNTVGDPIDSFYTGVYRGEVEYSGECDDYDRIDVTAYQHSVTPAPSTWTDTVGSWTSKTATQFTYVDAAAPYTPQITSHTSVSYVSGDVVKLSIPLSVTWPAGGSASLDIALRDGSGNAMSNIVTTLITGSVESTITAELLATGAASRITINLLILSGSGNVGIFITLPSFYYAATSAKKISETKTLNLDCDCTPSQAEEGIYLSWLNNLGHFDYWFFTAYKDHNIDITDSGESEQNIFPNWPNSYGEFADTINRQTFRESKTQKVIRSQHLTKEQVQAISKIKTSPLVQIVNSIYDRRTVIVDINSYTEYKEENKLHEISFIITYTDQVPSQRG